jgi:hypothetical protein
VKAITDEDSPALASDAGRASWPALAATHPPAEFILRRRDADAGLYGAASADRVCAALTWNVFHTLRLIAPSFWMRRLRARLVGLDGLDHVPLAATITLWDSGHAPADEGTSADVLIETDHLVIALLTLYRRDLDPPADAPTACDPVAALVDEVARRAGVRDCYVGLITTGAADSPAALAAVRRHAGLGVRAAPLPTARYGITKTGVGWATWGDLLAILQDASAATALDGLERDAARRTARWLVSIGVTPAR